MRSKINGISKGFYLGLLAFFLAACGGGGGGGGGPTTKGGFTGQGVVTVTITADKTTLAVNPTLQGPDPSGPFTNTFTVRVQRPDGTLFPASSITVDLTPSVAQGALYYLDGSSDHEDDNGNPLGFRRLVFDDTSGIVTGHFQAFATPGTVTLTASTTDPNTGQAISASINVTVGQGVSTGQPAQIFFQVDSSPLYITGQGQADVKAFQVFVLDDAGQPVPSAGANNLRLQLLAGRPNGGEKLTSVNAAGATQEGTTVNVATINGVAQVALHAGSLPGTVRVSATADRSDNNVDNGIQSSVTDVISIPIGSGEIVSLTFTGPFPGAVAQQANNLILGPNDTLTPNGVYSRLISVVAVDEFGNPPPAGQPITFSLIDSPATGYPTEGRGTFTISGTDGNPQEGGNSFRTQSSSLAGTRVNCLLVLEGQRPYQEGGRLVSGISGANLLSVYNAFNQTFDTGFTVPYTVGCAPHFGNVENSPGGVTAQTDASGVASTLINYPITQLGRNFKLVAEANGGKAGAVLSHWYLGVPDGSLLSLEPDSFVVTPGGTSSQVVKLSLVDGATPPAPLPAELLDVRTVITDPDETAAAEAEAAAVGARAAADSFTPTVDCDDPDPDPPLTDNQQAECDLDQELEDAAVAAEADAAAARAKADVFTPVICVTTDLTVTSASAAACAEPPVLRTDGQGLAEVKLIVEDLPPNGSVEFFFTTVGPEIQADTVSVLAEPTPSSTPPTNGGGT